jgi:hypothetical protein
MLKRQRKWLPTARKPHKSKATKEQVLERLREWVLAEKADLEAPRKPKDYRGGGVKVEWFVNNHLMVRHPYDLGLNLVHRDEGKLRWAMSKLNQEGLMSQPERGARGKFYYVNADIPPPLPEKVILDAREVKHPEGTMVIWNEKPRERKRRYSKRLGRRVGAVAALCVVILMTGCASTPQKAPIDTTGIPGIPEKFQVEPGPKGYYRIPLYDENGVRQWLMIPYGSEVQSLTWEITPL